jgi:hypothetical protein
LWRFLDDHQFAQAPLWAGDDDERASSCVWQAASSAAPQSRGSSWSPRRQDLSAVTYPKTMTNEGRARFPPPQRR